MTASEMHLHANCLNIITRISADVNKNLKIFSQEINEDFLNNFI